jgi:hypothetical protein
MYRERVQVVLGDVTTDCKHKPRCPTESEINDNYFQNLNKLDVFSNSFTVNGGEHVNNEHGFVLHEQDGNTNSKTDSVNYEFDLAKRTEAIDQRDACLFHDTTDKKKSTYCCNHDIICTALFDTESFFL